VPFSFGYAFGSVFTIVSSFLVTPEAIAKMPQARASSGRPIWAARFAASS